MPAGVVPKDSGGVLLLLPLQLLQLLLLLLPPQLQERSSPEAK
jgi:hypothetical protein